MLRLPVLRISRSRSMRIVWRRPWRFLEVLAGEFALDAAALDAAIEAYRQADDPEVKRKAERRLRQAITPPSIKLLI